MSEDTSDPKPNPLLAPMQFTEDFIEIPVKVGTKDYVLCEANEEVAKQFANKRADAIRQVGDVRRLVGVGELQSFLLSKCLFELGPDDKRIPVSQSTMLRWRSDVVKQLFERAKAISGLNEEDEKKTGEEELGKNLQPPTQHG